MKDEIKEILEYLKNDNYFTDYPEYEVSPYDLFKSLNSVQTDKLLDYITNLQQELEIRQQDINNLTYQLAKEKSKIDKAKNKLKEHKHDLDYEPWSIYEIEGNILFDLKNILNGDDKDE